MQTAQQVHVCSQVHRSAAKRDRQREGPGRWVWAGPLTRMRSGLRGCGRAEEGSPGSLQGEKGRPAQGERPPGSLPGSPAPWRAVQRHRPEEWGLFLWVTQFLTRTVTRWEQRWGR